MQSCVKGAVGGPDAGEKVEGRMTLVDKLAK